MPNSEIAEPSSAPAVPHPARPRKRRWLRIALWTAVGLIVAAVLAVAFGILRLRSAAIAALPQLDGEIQIAGLSAPVTVQRDAHGVPHISAATLDDLLMAQGYVTAQDRLWQMDVLRRNANGDLAEVLGGSLVPHDKTQRVLQFRKTAERIYSNFPTDARARMDAYAHGVNLFIDQHPDSLPPEFRLLFYKPKPWTAPDSIVIGLMMVQTLDSHWDVKLSRERVSAALHNTKLESDLYPVGSWRDHAPTGIQVDLSQPRPMPSPASDDEDDDRTQTRALPPAPLNGPGEDPRVLRALLGLPDCAGCAPGSNNWVISGKHAAGGKPLLSNDMHLGLTVPNIWYMADLRAPGIHAAGVTLPGMPFVIAGHNEHVAWGFTALYADTQDLYIEKLDGKGNYQAGDASWQPLKIDRQVIHVRGRKDVTVDVESTAHGPLLNPIFTHETRPIALKWALYDPALNTLPLYELNVASSCAEFTAGLKDWSYPTQSVVYSDDQGHIAYHAVGRVPIRKGGHGIFDLPVPHDTAGAQSEWQGYIPFDGLPNQFDPPSGFLATANSRVTTDKSTYTLTNEWADPYRAERIYKSLQGRDGLKPADLLAVQTDIYSEVDQELAHRFAYAIDHTAAADARLRKAADLLRSWDGRLTTDSAAASLITQARRAFWPLILEPKLGKDAWSYSWSESDFAEEEIIMHGSADWLPKSYKNWDALLTDAVHKGMDQGKAPAEVSDWRYGSWHVVDLEHPLAAFLPLIGRVAGTGELPLSGDTVTVKQVGREFGPSQRFTMDWNDVDGSTENIVLGESGNPLSPYFRDQWTDYYSGATFPLPFSAAAVAAQTQHTLLLKP